MIATSTKSVMHLDQLGIQTFGASAPLMELQQSGGFTQQAVVARARQQLVPR